MLKELNRLTLPVAISIASFDGTYFIAAGFFELTQREMVLGLVAGAVSGLAVLAAVLVQSARHAAPHATSSS
ncbi:MAG TPA: hypothetical protein VN938_09850 [Xanthobacteraceae bacterium]|nr:hypothetical protein [Xanthobacteraceae bacterium]